MYSMETIYTADKATHILAIQFWRDYKKNNKDNQALCGIADKHIKNSRDALKKEAARNEVCKSLNDSRVFSSDGGNYYFVD